jgi:hypothetical protein
VSGWPTLFLGLIAIATVVMAAVQVGVLVYTAHLARRVSDLSTQIEREIRPVLANVSAVSANAARASALVAAQTERVDRLFADLAARVDETAALIQNAVVVPARESRAVLAAITAAIGAFRELRAGHRPRQAVPDEEDPLFIG